jgi:hypothetical protein
MGQSNQKFGEIFIFASKYQNLIKIAFNNNIGYLYDNNGMLEINTKYKTFFTIEEQNLDIYKLKNIKLNFNFNNIVVLPNSNFFNINNNRIFQLGEENQDGMYIKSYNTKTKTWQPIGSDLININSNSNILTLPKLKFNGKDNIWKIELELNNSIQQKLNENEFIFLKEILNEYKSLILSITFSNNINTCKILNIPTTFNGKII